MKKQKKVAALALALALVLGTSVSAMGETATDEGSITVKGVTSGKTYNIYRIFDLTLSGETTTTTSEAPSEEGSENAGSEINTDATGGETQDTANTETTVTTYSNYAYTLNSKWKDFFVGDSATGSGYLVAATADNATTYATCNQLVDGSTTYYINITESNASSFAQAALAYAVNVDNDGTDTANESDTSITFSSLPLGYYLVYPVGAADILTGNGSVCSLTSTDKAGQVDVKATYPTIEKNISGITRNNEAAAQDGTVQVGDTVTYTITGEVPDVTGYTSYTYQVSDTMSAGLTFETNSTVSVKFGTGNATTISATTANPSLTVANNGFVLTYDMVQYLIDNTSVQVGDAITITYSATVNASAIDSTIKNQAKLIYSNDPTSNSTSTQETPKEIIDVFTLNIDVNKYEKNDSANKLANAAFVLSKGTGDDKVYLQQDSTSKVITWVSSVDNATTFTTDENGAVSIDGLAAGTYSLEETAAPNGYNKLANAIPIVLTATKKDDGTLDTLTATVNGESATTVAADGTPTTQTYLQGKTLTVGVANATGSLLPATGGMGTTLFLGFGGLLLVGAMVLLITRWRMKVER